jgi:hypothetical protein
MVLFRNTCLVGRRSKDSSFWYQIFKSFTTNDLIETYDLFEHLPRQLIKGCRNCAFIIIELLVSLFESWVGEGDTYSGMYIRLLYYINLKVVAYTSQFIQPITLGKRV